MLKRIYNINEYFERSSAEDTFGNLVSKLQTFKDSKIKDLDAKSIGEILKVYCSDLGLNYAKIFKNKDTEEQLLEEVVIEEDEMFEEDLENFIAQKIAEQEVEL